MEHDIYDSLRLTATTCEKIADVLNAIAECFKLVVVKLNSRHQSNHLISL